MRWLKKLYGRTAAADVGPLALKAVRQAVIGKGVFRCSVNHAVNRIRRMFKWAVENELNPARRAAIAPSHCRIATAINPIRGKSIEVLSLDWAILKRLDQLISGFSTSDCRYYHTDSLLKCRSTIRGDPRFFSSDWLDWLIHASSPVAHGQLCPNENISRGC